jgi:hypothetical protein
LHSFSVDVFGPIALSLAAEPAADGDGGYLAFWSTSTHCLTDSDPTVPSGYDCDLGEYKITIVLDFRDCEGYAPKCHRGKRLHEGSEHDCNILGSPFQSQLVLPSVDPRRTKEQTPAQTPVHTSRQQAPAGRWRLVDCGTPKSRNNKEPRSKENFETFACASSLSTDITNPANVFMTMTAVLDHHTFRALPISRIMEHVSVGVGLSTTKAWVYVPYRRAARASFLSFLSSTVYYHLLHRQPSKGKQNVMVGSGNVGDTLLRGKWLHFVGDSVTYQVFRAVAALLTPGRTTSTSSSSTGGIYSYCRCPLIHRRCADERRCGGDQYNRRSCGANGEVSRIKVQHATIMNWSRY